MRIGVFGGTFDPPHLGHLHLAQAALAHLELERVMWVLTADPPHKAGRPLSSVEDRADMVRALIADHAGHELSRVDMDRPGPHWAADTVALLQKAHPGAELYYLMGGDSLRDLPTWGRPLDLLARCALGVLRRPGDEVDLPALEKQLPGVTAKVVFVEATPLEIASHEIRRRVRTGEPLGGLVSAGVEDLIRARGLYR